MDNVTIENIINSVVIFFSSATGAAILGVIVKAIISAIASTKNKKYSKLTAGDRADIANETASTVLEAVKGGVNIEADALLDKYTQGRIDALETKYNELIGAANKTTEYMRAVLSAVGDFRTITLESKTKIQELLKDTAETVEEIKTTPTPTITVSDEAIAAASTRKSSVSY